MKLQPNTTQIPNVILDEWLSSLTGAEFMVLMIIARQTYGWHKDSDWISYTQLSEKTGLSRRTITVVLKSLRTKSFIETNNQPGKTNQCKICTSAKITPTLSAKSALVPSAKNAPTKETHTKEKNIKKSSVNTSLVSFLSEFNLLFNSNYRETLGRKIKLQARLKSYSLDEILKALKNLSQSKFHTGDNDRGWKASPDFLLRSDEEIDKWLNTSSKRKDNYIHI